MKCSFTNQNKECNIKCQYYNTCTRSEYQKKEGNQHGTEQRMDKTS